MTKPIPDSRSIRETFDNLSEKYDIFNRLTSMGMDKSWRSKALEPVREGMRVLDLGCGTGDLALEVAQRLTKNGEVTGIDFSGGMLEVARERYVKAGEPMDERFRLFQKSAEELPVEEKPYDLVVSGFVLRNMVEHIDKILRNVYASLKPGGEISFLDFTEPPGPVKRTLWRTYMNTVVAAYGKLLFGKDFPLFYMTDSAARFAKPPEFLKKLKATGFKETRVQSLFFGTIVLYRARKP